MEKKFGIKVISNSCGILPHTLRVWEQRYQVFTPERSESGQRLYSRDDLKKAKLLSRLIEQGYSISSVANYALKELEFLASEIMASQTDYMQGEKNRVNIHSLIGLLADFKIEMVANEIQHLRMSVGAKDFIFNIILPVMREIGLLVAKGKYSVTQEHIISTIVRDQLSQIYLPNLGPKYNEMILATPEGNLHELSILIADIICRSNRISTRYLGAAHPAECLGEAINALNSPYLVLGVISSDQWNYVKKMIPYLNSLDLILNKEISVILGGGFDLNFPKYKNIKQIRIMKDLLEFDHFLGDLI